MRRGLPWQQAPLSRPRIDIHAPIGRSRNGEQNLLFQNAANFVGMKKRLVSRDLFAVFHSNHQFDLFFENKDIFT